MTFKKATIFGIYKTSKFTNLSLSLVHMHNIHPGANIQPRCKFAAGVYFGHVNGVL